MHIHEFDRSLSWQVSFEFPWQITKVYNMADLSVYVFKNLGINHVYRVQQNPTALYLGRLKDNNIADHD